MTTFDPRCEAWRDFTADEIVRRVRCLADDEPDEGDSPAQVWRHACDMILLRMGKHPAQAMEARQGGDAEGGSGVADSATPSGDVPEISPTLNAPEGSSGEIEGLLDAFEGAVLHNGLCIGKSAARQVRASAAQAVEATRTALLSRITSLSSNTSGRDPSGPGSREPGPAVPASGFDPSRIFTAKWLDPQCIDSGCQSLLWHERYQDACRGRREFREAFRRVRRQLRELERARDVQPKAENPKGLSPQGASPIAESEAPRPAPDPRLAAAGTPAPGGIATMPAPASLSPTPPDLIQAAREALEPSSAREIAAWEEWATAQRYDMHEHPLHYLFMDAKTNAARQGWKAGVSFALRALQTPQGEDGRRSEGWGVSPSVGLDGVRPEAIKAARDEGGWWKSCSGCHETNEGHSTGWYAHSKVFGCEVGSGCVECGGLGVTWEYYTDQDYARMAEEARVPTPRPSQGEQSA